MQALERSAELLNEKLRSDELHPDLYDQFFYRHDSPGCHKYFVEPYHSVWGPLTEYSEYIPFPAKIYEEYGSIECASFMGIIPELNRVWITIDSKLILWNYMHPNEYDVYDCITEVILSVALAHPKPGVFIDAVKYILVLATPVEINLLAIEYDTNITKLKLIPTIYNLPSDNVAMFKIVGTKLGRIFMGGNDGNLYELDYRNSENFLASLVGFNGSYHKCQKINRSVWNWTLYHVIPSFLKTLTGFEDELIDVVIDDVRNVLYTLTMRGMIAVFYLGADGTKMQCITRHFDLINETNDFLSGRRDIGDPTLKADYFKHDSFINLFNEFSDKQFMNLGLNVISLHIIPPHESAKVHAVVFLTNGIRMYLSLGSDSYSSPFFSKIPPRAAELSHDISYDGTHSYPSSVKVVHVRSPPKLNVIQSRFQRQLLLDEEVERGSAPAFMPNQVLSMGQALSTKGVVLLSMQNADESDSIVAIYEDLVSRSASSDATIIQSLLPQPPQLREGVSRIQEDIGSEQKGKIFDIRENTCIVQYRTSMLMKSLFVQSATPASVTDDSDSSMAAAYSNRVQAAMALKSKEGLPFLSWTKPKRKTLLKTKFGKRLYGLGKKRNIMMANDPDTIEENDNDDDDDEDEEEVVEDEDEKFYNLHPSLVVSPVPVLNTTALAPSGMPTPCGYDAECLDRIAILSELAYQSIPLVTTSLTRQFLVLSNAGLHTLRKLRPIDVLYRNLSQLRDSTDFFQVFFESYGLIPSCAMCISLAVGLPCDAGATRKSLDPLQLLSTVPLDSIQSKTMQIIRSLTEGPSYKRFGGGGGMNLFHNPGSRMKDSRVVVNGYTHEFIRSPAHEAMFLVLSRILRPIWLRPIAIELESTDLVSAIWCEDLISQIRQPLIQFQGLLRGFYSSAVVMDPHKVDFITLLENNPEDNLVTKQMHAQSYRNVANPERMLLQQSKNLEDISIHNLYRLISRSVHGLNFIEILLKIQNQWMIKVNWSFLKNITFRSLVVSIKTHEMVRNMIHELLNHIVAKEKRVNVANRIIEWLSNETYHYFSFGDQQDYQAQRSIDQLKLSLLPGSGTHIGQDELQNITNFIISTTKYWYSADKVLPTATNEGNPALAKYCDELIRHGVIGRKGVVDLCLFAAENFLRQSYELNERQVTDQSAVYMRRHAVIKETLSIDGDVPRHDKGLYHGGNIFSAKLAEDLVSACYSTLIQNILEGSNRPMSSSPDDLLGEGPEDGAPSPSKIQTMVTHENLNQQMTEMIDYAVNVCPDQVFHEMILQRLLNEVPGQLVIINSPYAEEFLREKDPQLLYSYYEKHGEHQKASNLMSMMAKTEEDLNLLTRIDYLLKAIASAEHAANKSWSLLGTNATFHSMNGNSVITTRMMEDVLLDLKDSLEIAEYQRAALQLVELDYERLSDEKVLQLMTPAQRSRYDAMGSAINRLHNKLVDITELYNKVCEPYKLWELCLSLLNASKTNDPILISKLWKSVIYRLVPIDAQSDACREFLRSKRESQELDIDKRHQCEVDFHDTIRWIPKLERTIIDLGVEFEASKGGNPTFPEVLILNELEEIGAMVRSAVESDPSDKGWTTMIFLEMGYPYANIIETFSQILDSWRGQAAEKILHLVTSISFTLLHWTRSAKEYTKQAKHEEQQLQHAVRSTRLRKWMKKLVDAINNLSNGRLLSENGIRMLQDVRTELEEVEKRVRLLQIAS